MKYIKSLERNLYWKKSKFGYTNNIEEAGLFDESEVLDILRNANVVMVEDIAIDEDKLSNEYPMLPFKKRDIQEVLSEINTSNRYKTNPISIVFNKLIENHYYPESSFDNLMNYGEHINYGDTFNKNIKIDKQNLYIKMSIYRSEDGYYELTVYDNYDPDVKNKKRNKLKINK